MNIYSNHNLLKYIHQQHICQGETVTFYKCIPLSVNLYKEVSVTSQSLDIAVHDSIVLCSTRGLSAACPTGHIRGRSKLQMSNTATKRMFKIITQDKYIFLISQVYFSTPMKCLKWQY